MQTNGCQVEGRHENDSLRLLRNNNQKPKTTNRFDAFTDELIGDDINFHQSGTIDDERTISQPAERSKRNDLNFCVAKIGGGAVALRFFQFPSRWCNKNLSEHTTNHFLKTQFMSKDS